MEYLFKRWRCIEDSIRRRKRAFLLLDYDGTLTPIRARPEVAKLSVKTKKLLKKLRGNPFFKLAIVSGRPLKEIKKIIGIKGIIYAGNHGLELEGPKIKFINSQALLNRKLLSWLYQSLRKKLSDVEGAYVENKGLTLSVHFRLVKKKDFIKLKVILGRLLEPWIFKRKIRLTYGKMVYEIRPPVNWDKGKMVKWVLARYSVFRTKTLPICIGDDRTDEDMFGAVGRRGISICVGRPNSSSRAKYYLKNTEEVKKFLNKLDTLTK